MNMDLPDRPGERAIDESRNLIIETGVVQGAEYTIACPISESKEEHSWNGNVLIFCHGCRPVGIPLQANLNLDDELSSYLFGKGWIVAMTSYRKQGQVLLPAIEDVKETISVIWNSFGEIKNVYLEGESMGGHIVTLIAENYPEIARGCLGSGAALLSKGKEEEESIPLAGTTKIPILYLTNFSETTPIRSFISKCEKNSQKASNVVVPVQWIVSHPGHCNFGPGDRILAFETLLDWVENGVTPEDNYELPVISSTGESEIQFDEDLSGGWGAVDSWDEYGDLELTFRSDDLEKIGIRVKDSVLITFHEDPILSKQIEAVIGSSGDSFDVNVPKDAWMLYWHASGVVCLCKNQSSLINYFDIASCFKVFVGSKIHLKRQQRKAPGKLQIPFK
jgi:hypothetical protein